ncbi:hypothetical protein K458DRAFT_412088 [Lentithecium fluviatile CBS 122367]|uniref:Uncharacterized protein n=1 Tax=Lentithecium fluviatile CBS 122367 TaxID=1168545 RepID=A0A6G1JJL3_9PLEO|nr:hypothetical protein K458DRAFT_412088 [Lentithecium fluviatile CBS 122367]
MKIWKCNWEQLRKEGRISDRDTSIVLDHATPRPVFIACKCRHLAVVETLLEMGADPSVHDTAMDGLCEFELGEDPSVHDARGSLIGVLCECVKDWQEHGLKVLSMLIKKGANANGRGPTGGNTPLHILCRCNPPSLAAITLLLSNGAEPNSKTFRSEMPLHLLCLKAGPKLTEMGQIMASLF